jgi:4-diphosphocytidyl-2-C-methyl-D-erythritol kinase
MITRAYAKINLGLRIIGKRPDGYHDIETVLHRVNVFDEITLEPASSVTIECQQQNVPNDATNLCVRAVVLFQKLHTIRDGIRIILKKHIPVGAGLGGGSSDAAATLRLLTRFWNKPTTERDLQLLALQLGSDVPFFLNDGSAYAKGRGEILEYFELDIPYWIVTVYPNLHISTAWAYRETQISNRKSDDTVKKIIQEHITQPRLLMNLLQNDFEPLVLRTHEPVARVKQALYIAGAEFAQMSGSGSAVYGLFSDELFVHDVAKELGKHYAVFLTPPHFQPGTE